MVEYHLNEDPYCESLKEKGVTVIVTDYECGSYDGSGTALLLFQDGTVGHEGLGHCSCYGPVDDIGRTGEMTLAEFREANEQVTTQWSDKLAAKFLELVDALYK